MGGPKDGLSVNTVDSCQGSEYEITIISTVKTDTIGFLKDRRRMNVALSRARSIEIVVGDSSLLN